MTFQELGLNEPILRALADQGYEQPSPIQAKAIPPALTGRDVLGCAQTGTGKTCAFAAPILQQLSGRKAQGRPIRALILTPTRELALQIQESFEAYGKYLPLRSTVIFGGVGQAPQVERLKKGVDILVATPGRLGDLYGQKLIDLSRLEIFVLDEADRMLDMGFIHDVRRILGWLPAQKQTLFFSATMPPEVQGLVDSLLHNPAKVAVNPISSPVEVIDQKLYYVDRGNKTRLLAALIRELDVKNALVFTRTKHGANKVAGDLVKAGISAAAIHGNKSQTARQQALADFKGGAVQVLVATDIAARGLDIEELSHVFNYNLPDVPETYVHRIGRTARAGADGTAVSFCAPEEMEYLAGIEKLNRRKIPVVSGHPWDGVPAPVRPEPPVRGKKPKAAAAEPAEKPAAKQPKPAKAEAKNAKPEKKAAPAPKVQAKPAKTEKEEPLMDDTKRTTGGRSNDRRSNNNSRPRREQNAPARGSNAQPKFDPHFVSAPEATPLRPAKKTPAAPAAPAIRTAAQPAQQNSSTQGQKSRRNDRSDRPARQNSQPAAQSQSAEQGRGANNGQRGRQNASRNAQPAPARAPRAESNRRGRAAAARDEDPGLMLISRRPPQQKFTNFEEYMNAHGGATAPIEDHSDEV